MTATMDWASEFPGVTASTYLNSCSHGLLPRRTRAAVDAHLARWESDPDWDAWNVAIEDARRAFARLIGARDDEVAVQANASSAIASVMNALPAGGARRALVTCDLDFPTAPFLAERQRERGFEHRHLRVAPRPLRVEAWAREMREDVALGCAPAVASFTGARLDAKGLVDAAHAHGVPVLLDAFQAVGTYPIDVRRLDVDFLVSGVYKWLLAPAGLAFLYVRRDHHALRPTTSGWYGAATPYKFDPFEDLAPDARRFQYGGASVMGCAAAAASLRLLDELGIARIEGLDRALVDRVLGHAAQRKYEVLTPEDAHERASIVTFRVPHLERALEACRRERVVLNSRLGGLRVSPHFYNSAADVDRLFEVLDTVA